MRAPAALALAAVVAAGTAGSAAARDNAIVDLFDNASYEAEAASSVFPQTIENQSRPIDDKRLQIWTRIRAETYAELSDELVFNLSGQVVYSNQQDELRGVFSPPGDREPEARYIDLRESNVRLEKEDFDFTLGRALLPIGLSTIYSPADRYSLVNGANPLHAEDVGVLQATLDWFIEDDTLSLSVLPFEERIKSPTGESRWLGSSGDDSFFSLTLPVGVGVKPNTREVFRSASEPQNWGYLVRYQGVREGFDFFGAAHLGPSAFPVIRFEGLNNFAKEAPAAVTLSAGAAATFGAWEFHAEGAYQNTIRDRDQDFLKAVVGVSYRETDFAEIIGLEEITPVFEYAQDISFDGQDAVNFVVNSAKTRPHPDSFLSKVDFRQNDDWTYRIGSALNFREGDYTFGAEIEHTPTDNWTLKLRAQFYGGQDDTQFGRWRRNDNITLSAVRKF